MPVNRLHWRSFDPHGRYWYQAWRTIGSAAIALVLWHVFLPSAMGLWLLITAVILLQVRLGCIWWQKALTIGVIGVVTCVVAMLLLLAPTLWWWQLILLIIVTFCGALLAVFSREMNIAGVILILITLLIVTTPAVAEEAWLRLHMLIIGTIIAMLSTCIGVRTIRSRLNRSLKTFLEDLSRFNMELTLSYLKADALPKGAQYESQLLCFQSRLLYHWEVIESFEQLRHRQLGEKLGANLNELLLRIEVLMEHVVTMGNFRHRVEDMDEITDLAPSIMLAAESISHHLKVLAEGMLGKKVSIDLSIFEEAIEDIEKVCHDDMGLLFENEIVFEPFDMADEEEFEPITIAFSMQTTRALGAYVDSLKRSKQALERLFADIPKFREVLL